MVGMRRLTKPTLGVSIENGCAESMPTGAIIDILVGTVEGNQTVDVIWHGKHMMMFVNDLKDSSVEAGP